MSSYLEVPLAEDLSLSLNLEEDATPDFELAYDDDQDVLVDIPSHILTDVASSAPLDTNRLLSALSLRDIDDLQDIVVGLARRRASLEEAVAAELTEQKELQEIGAGMHQTIVHLRSHLHLCGIDPGAPNESSINFAIGAAGVFLQTLAQPSLTKDDFNFKPSMVKHAAHRWLSKGQEFGQLVSTRLRIAQESAIPSDGAKLSKTATFTEELGIEATVLPTLIENMQGGAAVSTLRAEKKQDRDSPPSFGQLFSYFSNPGEKPIVAASSAGPDSDAPPSCSETSATSASEWIAPLDNTVAEEGSKKEENRSEPRETWASSLTDFLKEGIFRGAAASLSKLGAEKHRCRIAEEDMANIEDNYCFARDKVVAQITFADGKVGICTVATDDKCKDAAKRFVSEHALPSSVKAPLRLYLKKCQASATSFPVQVKASLKEICVQ